jgi:hypothetical protein
MQVQKQMRGSLHCGGFAAFGRDDASFVVLGYGESESKSKGKCGGLSAAAALPPSVEMTHLEVLGYGESKSKSNGKCGGLSTAAALPPSVEMTHLEVGLAVEMTHLEVGLACGMTRLCRGAFLAAKSV